MFLVLPIGHDQPVYDRPWLTIALIAACTVIFAGTSLYALGVEEEMDQAAGEIDDVLTAHPYAHLSFTVDGLPEGIAGVIIPLIDTRPDRVQAEGDAELEAAMVRFVDAMNHHPVLRFGYRPGAPRVSAAVAHIFMHGGIFHLLGNMLFLWVAGGLLECFWRRWAFVVLYLGAAAAGLLAHHISDPTSLAPVVGASGAIAGLIGAFVVCYPRSRIKLAYVGLIVFKPIYGVKDIPAWLVIPIWAGTELLYAVLDFQDGTAYWAHVGGFACGLIVGGAARLMGLVAVDAGHEPELFEPR